MGSNAKTDNFLKAIRRHVKAQKRQMLSEVSQIKEEQLTIAKNKAKQDSEALIARRMAEKHTEMTCALAQKTQDGQRELYRERVRMTDEVFAQRITDKARECFADYLFVTLAGCTTYKNRYEKNSLFYFYFNFLEEILEG